MSEADILAQKEGFADAAEKEEVMRAKGDTDIIQVQRGTYNLIVLITFYLSTIRYHTMNFSAS
jgi:hypothetical protein